MKAVLAWLARRGTKATRDGMARYAIPSDKAFGIPVGVLRQHAKKLGRSHELALALWETDKYEARMLATFLDDPAEVTPAQMERWCRDFDNWAICDTACFHLFDRTPHAWGKVEKWAGRRDEFVKRASFALLASLSVHDKRAEDRLFMQGLALIERGCDRRAEFREEGGELGAPLHRQTQCGSSTRRPSRWPNASRGRRCRRRDGSEKTRNGSSRARQ